MFSSDGWMRGGVGQVSKRVVGRNRLQRSYKNRTKLIILITQCGWLDSRLYRQCTVIEPVY